jgi:hypothetical protein
MMLVRWLGGRTLGLGYAITLADLVLAPGTPSNTARSGGTVFPVISNIPGLYGSEPGPTARKIGSYIMWTAFAATCVTSSMFITALAPNAAALSIVKGAVQKDALNSPNWLRSSRITRKTGKGFSILWAIRVFLDSPSLYPVTSISPLRMAYLTNSVRLWRLSLAIMFARCRSTVLTLMVSLSAMS